MKTLGRKWKIYINHHSHTDIGYTERQERIEQYHVNFIRQAIDIAEQGASQKRPEWAGYRWTCETFWAVERFLAEASETEREKFIQLLRRGDIELSGTYLNMTELVDHELMQRMLHKARYFADTHGVMLNSAMTADINGYSWGYSQAMVDAGIENLLSCVHTHHGMYAIGRKQTPFYWETPNGNRLLVWNAEHYMMGNDLGLNPDAVLSYTVRDEFNVWGIAHNHWELAETRVSRYLHQLEQEGYPYDFIIVNVMGLLRDNAAPNGRVAKFVHEWNERHRDSVELEMTTLSRFFAKVNDAGIEIPTYRGDWPDWWSDGVASTPIHTQIFRDAQRQLQVVKGLDPDDGAHQKSLIEQAEYQLTMYAEHTWGYHSSISEPWNFMVQQLGVRKEAYASNGSRLVYTALDAVLKHLGDPLLRAVRGYQYKVINPQQHTVRDLAMVYLEGEWETAPFAKGMEVVDVQTGDVVPHQQESVSRGLQLSFPVTLNGSEARVYQVRATENQKATTTASTRLIGNDRVDDLSDLNPSHRSDAWPVQVSETHIESPFVRIDWSSCGITGWVDKTTGLSLLSKSIHTAFTPVYEVTPSTLTEMRHVRSRMGRNRKGMNVSRSAGRLSSATEITNGPLYAIVELTYQSEGVSFYAVRLKVHALTPRVDVSVRLHKNSVWEAENLYLSLPFAASGDHAQLWLDKPGAAVRPGLDQLPGTLTDFYCVQEGIASISDTNAVVVAMPDTPLLQTGPLSFGERKLAGQGSGVHPLYVWAMTNYWETNFKATMGGFYEFRFSVLWGKDISSLEDGLQTCRSVNTGVVAFRFQV